MDFSKHKRMDFQNIKNLNLRAGTIFYVRPAKNLPWDQGEVIKKIGPDRFSRFSVYWSQTDNQKTRQTEKN